MTGKTIFKSCFKGLTMKSFKKKILRLIFQLPDYKIETGKWEKTAGSCSKDSDISRQIYNPYWHRPWFMGRDSLTPARGALKHQFEIRLSSKIGEILHDESGFESLCLSFTFGQLNFWFMWFIRVIFLSNLADLSVRRGWIILLPFPSTIIIKSGHVGPFLRTIP